MNDAQKLKSVAASIAEVVSRLPGIAVLQFFDQLTLNLRARDGTQTRITEAREQMLA